MEAEKEKKVKIRYLKSILERNHIGQSVHIQDIWPQDK